MRIQAVHNRYLIGGEDQSHLAEVALLREMVNEVDEYLDDNQNKIQLHSSGSVYRIRQWVICIVCRARVLPDTYKINGKPGKIVLRKLPEKYIPGDVGKSLAWRRKQGFEVPVSAWLHNNLRESVEDRLSPGKLSRSGLLNSSFVMSLKKNFFSSRANTPMRRKIWMLLCFQTWYEMHESGFGFR